MGRVWEELLNAFPLVLRKFMASLDGPPPGQPSRLASRDRS
jgi:hypothetical protein